MSSLPLLLALALVPADEGHLAPASTPAPPAGSAPTAPVPAGLASGRPALRPEPGARLEVLAGHVRLAAGTAGPAIRDVVAGRSLHLAGAAVHLQVPAGARARVAWPGVGSLTLDGATALEWRFEGARVVWTLLGGGAVDGEVRRGRPTLVLSNGWAAACGAGAWRVTERPSGEPVVEQRAGGALRLAWRGDGRARPPVLLEAGERAVLAVPADDPRPDPVAEAPPWTAVDWPWCAHPAGRRPWSGDAARAAWPWGDDAGPAPAPRPRPAASAPADPPPAGQPVSAGDPEPVEAAGEPAAEPAETPEPVPPPPVEPAPAVDPRPEPAAEPEPEPAADPQPELAAEPEPEVPAAPEGPPEAVRQRSSVRGLGPEDLRRDGPVWVQAWSGAGFRVLELPGSGGGVTVTLDRRAGRSGWCFTPAQDLRLEPGGQVVLDAEGRVLSWSGGVLQLEAGQGE